MCVYAPPRQKHHGGGHGCLLAQVCGRVGMAVRLPHSTDSPGPPRSGLGKAGKLSREALHARRGLAGARGRRAK